MPVALQCRSIAGLMAEYRQAAEERGRLPGSRTAAVVIIAAWIAGAVLAGWLAVSFILASGG